MNAASAETKPARKKRKAPSPGGDVAHADGAARDPELAAIVAAFERGDYREVREAAPALAARTKDPEVRRAAEELARRVDPDSLSVYLVALASVLLVFLAAWYWTHPHGQP